MIEDDEEEPKEIVHFTNEFLLIVLNQLAVSIIAKRADVKCTVGEFVISIEDELAPEWALKSGNPVIIKVQTAFVLKQLTKKSNLHTLAHALQHALEMVPRMRHTLSVVPVADVIWRTEEMRRWHKAASDKALYHDKLLPEKEITYTELLVVTGVHKPTGIKFTQTEWISRAQPQAMRIFVRKSLTEKVKNAPTRDSGSQPERRIKRDLPDTLGHCWPTWQASHAGFMGNERASEKEEVE